MRVILTRHINDTYKATQILLNNKHSVCTHVNNLLYNKKNLHIFFCYTCYIYSSKIVDLKKKQMKRALNFILNTNFSEYQ